jgi:predicted transposase/invertase (TIGR01784 family)
MPYDNLCKYLSEKYPEQFACWILGQPQLAAVEVLKTELSIEPIRADSVTFLRTQEQILHLEFQVEVESNPPLPLRMLDYWVRLYRRYQRPITQVLIFLKPTAVPIPEEFRLGETQHRYQVLRLWEQDPEPLLEDAALLPLAVLARAETAEQLLGRVAEQVSMIKESAERRETSSYVQILAGLRFDKQIIRQMFQERIMRESVIYQEIMQEGLQEGIQKGLQQGLQEGLQQGQQQGLQQGLQQGKQEEAGSLVLRQLARRFGGVSSELADQIRQLSVSQLEDLGEALLDFTAIADLETWLQQHR